MTIIKKISISELKNELQGEALKTFRTIARRNKVKELEKLLEELYPDEADIKIINDLLSSESKFIYEKLSIPVKTITITSEIK